MAYKSIKEAIENELSVEIQVAINKMMHGLEQRHGNIHLTALDARKYKKHVIGLTKVLVMAMTRGQLIP